MKKSSFVQAAMLTAGVALSGAAFANTAVVNSNITEAEVLKAQQMWGNAVVQISKDFESGGLDKAKKTAQAALDAAYAYDMGPVLFKPTLAALPQNIRSTEEGALAYFVGGNKQFPNDSGFALKGWRNVESKNAVIHLNGNTALTMGNVSFTDKNGKVTTVDKTWGYVKDSAGNVKIVLHHSSLPYTN
ncbi:phosphoribosyl-AMP cyclohydrolase [Limnobacter alexandrii]|uniref:phosphoribosyl-AMP cyclohydrolase n=1 Tax=Limnobacter alexandrii TaxID=2570352 RepID=UPI001108A4E6|nr:phosphoribosyl-AMP cyclohydrolase [Limnobacter alexandrii]